MHIVLGIVGLKMLNLAQKPISDESFCPRTLHSMIQARGSGGKGKTGKLLRKSYAHSRAEYLQREGKKIPRCLWHE